MHSDRTPEVIKPALDFLRSNGDGVDLEILMELINEVPVERKNDLAVTIISLEATINATNAFEKLFKFDPDPIENNIVDGMFAYSDSIPTETLKRCLTLKSDNVRKIAAVLLQSRKAMDAGTAELLLTDSDPEVRLVAVKCLVALKKAPDEETIRKALVRQPSKGLLGFGTASFADESYYLRYQQFLLSQMSYGQLKQRVDDCSVLDYLEITTLYQRFTKSNLTQIRNDLKDGFKDYFDGKLNQLASEHGDDAKIVKDIRKLEEYSRKRLTTYSLDALCELGDGAELDTVRKTLDNHETYFSKSVLKFLGRFGDWTDKDRILGFNDRIDENYTFLAAVTNNKAKFVAAALYAIGKSRPIDLLNLGIPDAVRRYMIARMRLNDISGFSDDIIITELKNKNETLRKVMALKCTQALSQTRIRKLLDKYINHEEQRYYNSIHWLDLGASMPREVAKIVSKFELAKLE